MSHEPEQITLPHLADRLRATADALARFAAQDGPEPCEHEYRQGHDNASGLIFCTSCGDVRQLAPPRQLGFGPGTPAACVPEPYPGHAGPRTPPDQHPGATRPRSCPEPTSPTVLSECWSCGPFCSCVTGEDE